MKNILFVVPRYTVPGSYYVFPVGMGYVVSYMKHKDFNVYCLNLCHYQGPIEDLLADAIHKNSIDIICTGAMSFYWNEVQNVLLAARKIKRDIIIIVGGAIVTADPELAITNLPMDFGIIGEGEETTAELAAMLCGGGDPIAVNGIIYYNGDKQLIRTEPRKPIADLDTLPFPDYEALEYEKFLSIKWITQPSIGGLYFDIFEEQLLCEIVASRSCPFNCTFCYHPLGNKYRQRSLDNVFKEIDHLVGRYHIKIFNLLDELFSIDEKRITEFAQRIKSYNVKWMAQWRANAVNEEVLRVLKNSGLLMLGIGMESMSDIILESMKKKITKEQIEQAYNLCLGAGVRAGGNIILGDPRETEETIKESVDWWKKHPEHEIFMGFLLAVPDSEVWRYALTNNLIKDKLGFIKQKFPVINLTKLSDMKFNSVKRKLSYYALTHKYLMPGIVLSSEKKQEIYNNKQVYTFAVRCGACGNVSEYVYFKYSSTPYSIVLCKHCCKRNKIKTKKAFPEDYNAVYGFLFHYTYIFYLLYFKKFNIFRKIGRVMQNVLRRLNLDVSGYGGWLRQD